MWVFNSKLSHLLEVFNNLSKYINQSKRKNLQLCVTGECFVMSLKMIMTACLLIDKVTMCFVSILLKLNCNQFFAKYFGEFWWKLKKKTFDFFHSFGFSLHQWLLSNSQCLLFMLEWMRLGGNWRLSYRLFQNQLNKQKIINPLN